MLSERLGPNASKGFYDAIKKTEQKTLASLYKVNVRSKAGNTSTMKADRNIIKRLFTAANGGRSVNLPELVRHEMAPVPLSLANIDGSLLSVDKTPLMHILSNFCAQTSPSEPLMKTCFIVDGMALINAVINKLGTARTFGELASVVSTSVFQHFSATCDRVDVVFDTYKPNSIKQGTRDVRSRGSMKIRKKQIPEWFCIVSWSKVGTQMF